MPLDKDRYEELIAQGINPIAAAFVCGADHTVSDPETLEDGSIHTRIIVDLP